MGLNHCGILRFHKLRRNKEATEVLYFLMFSDLNIAVGSAVLAAADHRIDNRVMYSAGRRSENSDCSATMAKLLLPDPAQHDK